MGGKGRGARYIQNTITVLVLIVPIILKDVKLIRIFGCGLIEVPDIAHGRPNFGPNLAQCRFNVDRDSTQLTGVAQSPCPSLTTPPRLTFHAPTLSCPTHLPLLTIPLCPRPTHPNGSSQPPHPHPHSHPTASHPPTTHLPTTPRAHTPSPTVWYGSLPVLLCDRVVSGAFALLVYFLFGSLFALNSNNAPNP